MKISIETSRVDSYLLKYTSAVDNWFQLHSFSGNFMSFGFNHLDRWFGIHFLRTFTTGRINKFYRFEEYLFNARPRINYTKTSELNNVTTKQQVKTIKTN